MKREKIIAVLQALAVGDSFGKPTEFASRRQICSHFTEIHDLLIPEQALAHADMKYGTVTDDTEQNLFLLDQFYTMKEVSPGTAAQGLIRWYEESAEPQKYIGPSSAKALDALRHGVSWEQTGRTGTTCGGVMRTPAAFLCGGTLNDLTEAIRATLLPTHNTFQAMEAFHCPHKMALPQSLRNIKNHYHGEYPDFEISLAYPYRSLKPYTLPDNQ